MAMRGIRKPGAVTTTSAVRGHLPVAGPDPCRGDEPDHGPVTGMDEPGAVRGGAGLPVHRAPVGDGRAERHRGLLLRRRPVSRPAAAIARGRELAATGADIVDVGGESTRPGAHRVPAEVEAGRVVPVITELAAERHRLQRGHHPGQRSRPPRSAAGAGSSTTCPGGLADPEMARGGRRRRGAVDPDALARAQRRHGRPGALRRRRRRCAARAAATGSTPRLARRGATSRRSCSTPDWVSPRPPSTTGRCSARCRR